MTGTETSGTIAVVEAKAEVDGKLSGTLDICYWPIEKEISTCFVKY